MIITSKIQIDSEFQKLIPPLTQEEKELLTNSILKEGCREPIILWRRHFIAGRCNKPWPHRRPRYFHQRCNDHRGGV
jgi:hypothetical protein